MTNYPSQIDTNLSLPQVTDLVSPIRAQDHNNLQTAIVAIQTELGVNPSGVKGTVVDRFDLLNTSDVILVNADGYFTTGSLEGALSELYISISGASNLASAITIVDTDGYFISTTVEDALAELAAGTAVNIGNAEDGSYADGLFADFTPDTRLGVAIDRFNEILGELAPSPAPALSDVGFTTTVGTAGKVSFGTSNAIAGYTDVGTVGGGSALDINGSFTSTIGTALRKGIFATGTNKSGTVADAVVADSGTPTPAYPANAFADGYTGTLYLELNGTIIHGIDLETFASGNSTNANGSGFQNVSAGTATSFPNGNPLNLFYYRTADWIVNSADEQNGWNYLRIVHDGYGSFTRSTNYFEWVVDAATTATAFASESLGSLSMAGSTFISGVEYHTSGTASYGITVSNLHRNTYSSSASAISHVSSSNVSISSSSLSTIAAESDTEIISKTATINATRLLNGTITGNTTVDRTVQSDTTSSGASITGILMDNQSDTSTNTNEPLNGEQFRVASSKALTDTTGYNSGGNDSLWDQTASLTTGGAGYNDGLLVHGGTLYYPNNASVANGGDFSTITNGPAGNPDYSSATGSRVFWRYFYFSSATSNFVLNLNGSATVVDAGTVSSSTNEISVEFLLPNTTVNGSATVEFKDANIAYTADTGIGCYASTYGSNLGSVAGADWGISFGSKSTATAGDAVVIRITAGQGWTGSITNISLTAA